MKMGELTFFEHQSAVIKSKGQEIFAADYAMEQARRQYLFVNESQGF